MRRHRLILLLPIILLGCAAPSGTGPASGGVPSPAPSAAQASTGETLAAGATPTPGAHATAPSAAAPSSARDPLAAIRKPMSDLQSARLVAQVATGGRPDWQTSGFGSVWVATGGGDTVERVDLATNLVVATVPVAGPCLGLTADDGAVWAPSCGANEVDRIDPGTNRVTARVAVPGFAGGGEGQVAAAFGSLWLFTDDAGTLTRIDVKTNRIAATYSLPGGAALAATADDLWATVPNANKVLEINPHGTVVRSIPVGTWPRFIAAGEGAVWSLGQHDGDVTRIDPATGRVTATIPIQVPGDGGCIAAGLGSVWVSMPLIPFTQLDAATNRATAQYTGTGGDCIGVAGGSVWLSNNELGNVWRVRP